MSLPGPAALSLCTNATSQVGGDTLGSVPLGSAGSSFVPSKLCHLLSSRAQRNRSSHVVGPALDVGDAGVDLLALALRERMVSGSWVKHSTASPCPWLCQPQRKGADISAFVHFMSIYGHLGSLLTPSSQARC